ncbi:MAG: hypothetical protein ABEK50_04035 [bacterium]
MAVNKETTQRDQEAVVQQFPGLERFQDLDKLTRKMSNEELQEVQEQDGHRQYTLARKGQLTITLFHFDEGSELPKHRAKGLTSIHVLDGQFVVETDHSQQVLTKNDFFVMEPDLDHSICAYEESRAILTIEHVTNSHPDA